MVYFTSDTDSTPIVQLLQDDNTAPIGATGVKFRLINLARSTGLAEHLSMSVNSILAASNVGYGTASTYKELADAANHGVGRRRAQWRHHRQGRSSRRKCCKPAASSPRS